MMIPIVVTLAGIVTDVSALQDWNACGSNQMIGDDGNHNDDTNNNYY